MSGHARGSRIASGKGEELRRQAHERVLRERQGGGLYDVGRACDEFFRARGELPWTLRQMIGLGVRRDDAARRVRAAKRETGVELAALEIERDSRGE